MNVQEMQQISNSFNGAGNVTQSFSGEPVQTAREGKISDIIFDTTTDCNVPKDVESSIVYNKSLKIEETVTESEHAKLLPSDYIAMSLTGEDVAFFDEENISIEKQDTSQIDEAISRVKEQRKSARESISRQVDREREKEEHLEEKAELAAARQSLLANGLPVTPENIMRLSQAADMSLPASSLSSAHKNQLITMGLPITPAKIQQSTCQKEHTKKQENSFATVASQVEKILEEAGMEVTTERLEHAKYLFDNQLPVTSENVKMLEQLKELETLPKEVLIDRIAEAITDGFAPESGDLSVISGGEAAEQIDKLVSVSDQELHKTFTTEADFLRAKRQLEEIRLQMTIPAARQLAKQGIKIDINHLTEIVEGLRAQEREAGEKILQESDVPVTEENITRYDTILTWKERIMQAPAAVLGTVLDEGMNLSPLEFSEAAAEVKTRMEATYEQVGTEVRKDLGDNLTKAFQHVDSILEDLSLTLTEKNRRAVRILGYNQMEITKESIGKVKEFDSSVNQMLSRMKPEVVAELVKRRIDPMDMSMEELNHTLADIVSNEDTSDMSYEKYIWKMDKQGELTKEERKSMIGIYRLLDKVEKSDGAVIGSLIRDGREITLNSLLSAVRSQAAQGISAEIDDEFGGLTEIVTEGETISDQIGAAYAEELISTLRSHLSPEKLKSFGDSYMEVPLSELEENGTDMAAEELSYYDESAQRLREIMSESHEAEAFLREMEMPQTIENIMLAKEFLSEGMPALRKLWNKSQSNFVIENMDSEEGIEKAFQVVEEELQESIQKRQREEEISGEIHVPDIKLLGLMGKSISFHRKLRENKNYEIPIATETGITTMNVTIEKGESREGYVRISMNSNRLGNCTATFSMTNRVVSGFVTCEERDNLNQTKEWLEEIKEDMISEGFEVREITFATGNRKPKFAGKTQSNSSSTKNLYQVAKIFVQNIQRKEDHYAN